MGRRPETLMPEMLCELHSDTWTAPFWKATAEHRLVCARCRSCGTHRMPPSPFCHVCRSQEIEWDQLPGTGRVFTFNIVRHAVIPEVKTVVPYVVAVVNLDGAPGVRLIGNLVGMEPEAVSIDMPVRVTWDDVGEGVTIPRFTPPPASSGARTDGA